MFLRRLALLICLLALGCTPSIPEGRFECDTDEDCPPAFHCETTVDRCYAPDGG